MSKPILFATDGSQLAEKGSAGLILAMLNHAKATAIDRSSGLPCRRARDRPPSRSMPISGPRRRRRRLRPLSASSQTMWTSRRHTVNKQPADGILQAAKTRGCDLIVMAAHRADFRGFSSAVTDARFGVERSARSFASEQEGGATARNGMERSWPCN